MIFGSSGSPSFVFSELQKVSPSFVRKSFLSFKASLSSNRMLRIVCAFKFTILLQLYFLTSSLSLRCVGYFIKRRLLLAFDPDDALGIYLP